MRIFDSPHEKTTLRSVKDAKLVNQATNTKPPQTPDTFGTKGIIIHKAKFNSPLTFPNTDGQIGKGLKWSTKKYF